MMVTVIIPTLNEADNLPEVLRRLQSIREVGEVLVVDATSDDGTAEVAEAMGARVLVTRRTHRADQMNAGAAEARGDLLWFLHGDTWVPAESGKMILEAFADSTVVGGGFKRWFRSASPLLWIGCVFASLRSRWFGLYFGDQSLVVRRSTFEQLGGFADYPVFEDWDLCQRLKEKGKLAYLTSPVRSSARRFQRRSILSMMTGDLWLTFLYLRGESPYKLWQRLMRK